MPAGGRSHSGRQLLSRERSFPSCPQSGRPELRICALCSFVGVYGRGRIVETVSRSPSMQSEVLLGGHAFRSISPTRAAESHQASGCRQCQRRVDRAVRAGSADHLSLNHPSTVAVYDFGRTPEGVFYYAMEYLDGINLQDLVEQYGPQPGRRVISFSCRCAARCTRLTARVWCTGTSRRSMSCFATGGASVAGRLELLLGRNGSHPLALLFRGMSEWGFTAYVP